MCAECSGAPEASVYTMDRGRFLKMGGAGLAGAAAFGTFGPYRLLAQTSSEASLALEFRDAAKKYRVPEELLLAIGYVNTLWEMPPPEISPYEPGDLHGRGAYGIMHLLQNPARDTLGRAAVLTGLSEKRLKKDRASNVQGGAAVLAEMAGPSKPRKLDDWQEAVAEYGDGLTYVQEVYGMLESGASLTTSTGETLTLEQQDVEPPAIYNTLAEADYWRASWRPAHRGNYTNARRTREKIDKIVIHTAEGSYSGTISWFQKAACDASAHYVVSRKGAVAQCVRNEDIAWHAGWWYTNRRSIGIEHAGYVDNRNTWTRSMYHASARLSAYIVRRYGVPVDRNHIIGHNQVPGCDGAGGGAGCHTDPGRYFEWNRYMRLVRKYR